MRYFSIILLTAFPAAAAEGDGERQALYGAWGTSDQCAQTPIQPGGTVLAKPFEISARWLKHGSHWCSLKWGPLEVRENGLFTGAHAQCGEDSVRGYFVGMSLSGQDLTLRWDFPLANGPLSRCPAS